MGKPLIFVTNDDGIDAKGLRIVIDIMREIGKVIVVAPDKSQSGMSHALTVNAPIRFKKIKEEKDYSEYKCTGTPVDCLKIALSQIMKCKPDLIISGINHGSNSSINILYSGTVAVALDGALHGVNSVAFSVCDVSPETDFSHLTKHIRTITLQTLKNGLPRGTCLNVNIPRANGSEIKGIKVCKQADANWNDYYVEKTDSSGEKYYLLAGYFENEDKDECADQCAIESHYISVVPLHIDSTNYDLIDNLKTWNYEI
ncbi:MAG: 5'/3'-nucleotidase SurE [Bacteroidales bacterium]|nr:5'/3'-nucleotidase SurE [Bacteroidales bacterium]